MISKSDLVYWGVDDFGRPVFKKKREGNKFFFYCSTNGIIRESEDTPDKIESVLNDMLEGKDQLYFKGCCPDGEPDYPVRLQP